MLSTTPERPRPQPAPPAPAERAGLSHVGLDEWQEFVDRHPDSTVFHHRRWIEAISQQYGFGIHLFALKSGGQIAAAIPFLSGRSLLRRTKLHSLPFTDYLPILSCRPGAAEALIAALMADHPPCDVMNLRTDVPLANVRPDSDWVRHDILLRDSLAALSKKFKKTVHRNLQKANRAGLRFVQGTDAAAVSAFYRLHVLTRQKHGVPVQPKRYFDRLRTGLLEQGLGFVGLVYRGAEPVAAGIFLTFNGTMTYKYAASHPGALADRPNDWLVYSALQAACDQGCRKFDFGISDRNQEGLRRFKSNWAAVEADVYTVHLVGEPAKPIEQRRIFKLGSLVIRHSPPAVCRLLGEAFYRFAT